MLTGDNRRSANAIGGALGVRPVAGLLPDAKLAEIAVLRNQGPVAMVGDGINAGLADRVSGALRARTLILAKT